MVVKKVPRSYLDPERIRPGIPDLTLPSVFTVKMGLTFKNPSVFLYFFESTVQKSYVFIFIFDTYAEKSVSNPGYPQRTPGDST